MRCVPGAPSWRTVVPRLVLMITVVACSSTEPAATSNPVAGRYLITWTRAAAACSPQQLPAPGTPDSLQYAQVPNAATAAQLTVQVTLDDSNVLLSQTSAISDSMSSLVLQGTIAPTDSAFLTRASTRTEGMRVGGHTFFVTANRISAAQFVPLVETPPGNKVEVDLSAVGADTLTFHDGGPSGPVFTTCVAPEKIDGSKIVGD